MAQVLRHFRSSWTPTLVAALIALFTVCLFATTSLAANGRAERQLDEWKAEIGQIEEKLIRADLTDENLVEIRDRLEEIRTSTLALVEQLSPELQDLRGRLAQLGEQPESGEEPEALTVERAQLNEDLGGLEALVTQLEVNALVAAQLSGRAADVQRNRFLQRVFEPSHSILNPELWVDGVDNLKALFELVSFITKRWWVGLSEDVSLGGFVALAIAFVAATIIAGPVRIWANHLVGPDARRQEPSDLERLWRAVSRVVVNVAFALLALIIVIATATSIPDALSEGMQKIVVAGLDAIMWFVALASLTRAILAPGMPQWRLPPLSNDAAGMLTRLGTITAFIFAVHIFWSTLGSILTLPVELTVAQGAAIGVAVTALLFTTLWWTSKSDIGDETIRTLQAPAQFFWLHGARGLFWLIGVIVAAGLLSGYIALAGFLAEQIVITGGLLIVLYLVHHFSDELLSAGLRRGWIAGEFLRQKVGMSDTGVERLALLLSTLFDVVLLFVGLPLIVLQWAGTWIDPKSWLSSAFFGFRIGETTISLSTVTIALAVLIVGIIATRLVVHWLDQRLLSRTRLDRGVRNSIRTGTGYAGIIIAALLAVSYAGLDFTNVAIVAGALSVGIGFGLQSIVNNFVSGLILLAERPIRVGDWISVGGEDGYVTKINVRSTEIETFDRCTVIVPNSDIVAGSVKNWTNNQMGRVKVAIGVSYDAEPDKVQEILLSCAEDHPQIMQHPAPYVVFMEFGTSSLDFELRCFIVDVEYVLNVASDLRFRMYSALKEAGIEIPYPQHDIHIKGEAWPDSGAGTVQKRTRRATKKE